MSKEATIFILDVGPSMGGGPSRSSSSAAAKSPRRSPSPGKGKAAQAKQRGQENVGTFRSTVTHSTNLHKAIKAVSMMVQSKIIQGRKTDYVGLVLVGTDETNNALADSDSYRHITVHRELAMSDTDLVRFLEEELVAGSASGDILDGLIVAMDILIKFVGTKQFDKNIYVITDAASPLNTDDVSDITNKLKETSVNLDVIGLDFGEERPNASAIKKGNEEFLTSIVTELGGTVYPIHQALAVLKHFRKRQYRQTTVFRGYLDIGAHITADEEQQVLNIPVQIFNKTSEVKLPTAKKLANISITAAAGPDEDDEGGEKKAVERQTTYFPKDDEMTELGAAELIKAYRYGKMLVPFGREDEDAVKMHEERSLSLIGFIQSGELRREWLLGHAMLLVPAGSHDEQSAARTLSALAHAMYERDAVGLVRYIRQANAQPKMCALLPRIKPDYEGFIMVQMPFSEDVRDYVFTSLDRVAHTITPEQDAALDDFIDAMDLMDAAVDEDGQPTEAVKPSDTHNPAYERMYQCIQHRVFHPDDPHLPEPDDTLLRTVLPQQVLVDRATPAVERLAKHFPLEKVTPKGKGRRSGGGAWGSTLDGEDAATSRYGTAATDKLERALGGLGPDAELTIKGLGEGGPAEHVGTIHPVQDFRAMVSRRDVDKVAEAVAEMEKVIIKLVTESFGAQLYGKALECLTVLRETCVKEDEALAFNAYLPRLRDTLAAESPDFWTRVLKADVTLISHDESDESAVTSAEAQKFLRDGSAKSAKAVAPAAATDDAEDLLDMLE